MKIFRAAIVLVVFLGTLRAFAGTKITNENVSALDAPQFEIALESAYLLGVFNNPNSYEIGAEFLTARVRWGAVQSDNWLRGYNQFYVSAMAEPIFRGIENHYFGLNFGMRFRYALQLRSARQPARSLLFWRTGSGLDRQPSRDSRRTGPGFYV